MQRSSFPIKPSLLLCWVVWRGGRFGNLFGGGKAIKITVCHKKFGQPKKRRNRRKRREFEYFLPIYSPSGRNISACNRTLSGGHRSVFFSACSPHSARGFPDDYRASVVAGSGSSDRCFDGSSAARAAIGRDFWRNRNDFGQHVRRHRNYHSIQSGPDC